jgi:hypothetical protein
MMSDIMMSVVMLSVYYAECYYAECRYAECCGASSVLYSKGRLLALPCTHRIALKMFVVDNHASFSLNQITVINAVINV